MRNQTFDFQETPDEGESLILDILARTSPAKPNDLPHRMFMRLGLDFELPPAVRVHPCLNYKLGTDECLGQFPAMVMPLRTGAGRYCGLEVLFMDEVTLIAPVVMPIHMYWAEQVSGAHMEIQPPERGVLGVAVNLGQALAVHHLTGAPMCAVRNANDLRDLQIPTGVKQLLVFADQSQANEAQAVVSRARAQGIHSDVIFPETEGATWLDEFAYRGALPVDAVAVARALNYPHDE
jgi:hypothetical protein